VPNSPEHGNRRWLDGLRGPAARCGAHIWRQPRRERTRGGRRRRRGGNEQERSQCQRGRWQERVGGAQVGRVLGGSEGWSIGEQQLTAREQRELARLIRRSPLLDPTSRRRWLEVLPHLKPVDGARLRQILAA